MTYTPSTPIPRLYAITDDRRAETHVEQVRAFAAGGARLIQIRAKGASGRVLVEIVRAALDALRGSGASLIVNDRVDVAVAAGADGVHVGRNDLPVDAARAIVGSTAILGVSTHTPDQAAEAGRWDVDYVAYGPVFATGTKHDPDPVVGLEGISVARTLVSKPLVAIGGITLQSVPEVIAAGADSIAVIGDLWTGAGGGSRRVSEFVRSLDDDSMR